MRGRHAALSMYNGQALLHPAQHPHSTIATIVFRENVRSSPHHIDINPGTENVQDFTGRYDSPARSLAIMTS